MRPHYRVIYNGVDFTRFQNEKIDLLAIENELGVANFKYIIGMVASLSQRKDQDTLINAAPLILESFPDTLFLIIGDGPRREILSKKVRKIGLHDNVVFLGNRNHVERLMQIFDVAVLLTNNDIHLEGISNVIIEAMMLGIPVVASQGGGTNEIVKHNVNGILVPPKNIQKTAEAIIELLKDKPKAERLSEAAKISVMKKFNLFRCVKEYEDIYQELSSKRK
jgi:glycosyltransferase involved in cell wall biosynthesis